MLEGTEQLLQVNGANGASEGVAVDSMCDRCEAGLVGSMEYRSQVDSVTGANGACALAAMSYEDLRGKS